MVSETCDDKIPEPLGMHPEPVHGPGFALHVADESHFFVVRWCCRNQCGGIYSSLQRRWTLTTPITFHDFLEFMKTNDILPADVFESWEARRWIKACRLADD